MEAPETRYARSGDYSIAYQVVGQGDLDLVYVPGLASHMEVFWEEPAYSRFLHRLASFSRLILMDRLGTGLSDRLPANQVSTYEQRMDDIRAVMDAVGSERAAVLGWSEGAPLCALFAATYPQRTTALVMYGGLPRFVSDDDYQWGFPREVLDDWVEQIVPAAWGQDEELLRLWAPSVADQPGPRRWFVRFGRLAASPGAAQALFGMAQDLDIRDILPAIRVPTLVVHRTEDSLVEVEHSRYMAERIPDAKLVELPGVDHLWWFGDQDAIVDEVQEFLTGARSAPEPDRVLATIMFTDIVGSTKRAAELGDSRWRELLEGHEAIVRRELARHRGREVNTTGDGFLATFDGPGRAIGFEDRGTHELKGVPGEWRLYAVTG